MFLHFYSLLKLANLCVHTTNVVQSPGFTVQQVAMKQSTNQTHRMSCSLLTNQEKQRLLSCSHGRLPFLGQLQILLMMMQSLVHIPKIHQCIAYIEYKRNF